MVEYFQIVLLDLQEKQKMALYLGNNDYTTPFMLLNKEFQIE